MLAIYDKYNVRKIVTGLMTKYYENSLRNIDSIDVPEERKQVSNLNSFLSENLSGIKLVQTFNQEESKKEEFAKTNKKLFDAKMFIMFVFSIYRPLISFMYYTSIAITLPELIGEYYKRGRTFFLDKIESLNEGNSTNYLYVSNV